MPGLVTLQAGTVFAKDFRVISKLSEGGMGAVYIATQLSTGRDRALKLMHPELVGDAGLRAKFEQEARIGARVKSDHVVEVVAAGVEEETKTPYLVMELLEGQDLAARIQHAPLTIDEAFGVLEQMFHAIAAAHVGGIVHRDLKPENIFLRQPRTPGGAVTVKVLDFGIAKVVEEARTSSNTGALGSPFWMAPEQTERRATITPATDVWAAGLVAFATFVGKPFWRSANDQASSLTAFMRELVLEPIPPASTRASELGLLDRLPARFDEWFARCVAREPSERFRDGGAAWQALAAIAGKSTWPLPTSQTGTAPRVATADIALARTVAHTGDIEDDEPARVPVASSNVPYILGGIALLAVVGIGAVILARGAGSSTASNDPSTNTPQTRALVCPDGMASIAGGKFAMGSNDGESDERPVHDVTLNAFCIDLSEVTVSQFEACVKDGYCPAAVANVDWPGAQAHDHAVWDGFCNAGKADRKTHPINCVTWEQARSYCKSADKRLPSEEEWEYAARGPEGRAFPWGAAPPTANLLNACGTECAAKAKLLGLDWNALYSADDKWEGTSPVRAYPDGRTADGVFDLGGNVSEWTASPSCPYPGTNCMGELRSTRGSSFATDEQREARATKRAKSTPSARTADVGFRCAK